MPPLTFESFDPTPYQRAPRGDLRSILALARALAELAPRDDSDVIDRTATALDRMIIEAEDGLTVRRRESAPVDGSDAVVLDGCADTLWAGVRNGLEAKASFAHPGLTMLLAQHGKRTAVAAALREGRDQAERARALAGKLFGSDGLTFTQQTYPVQAESMGEILRLIDEDDLGDELDALLGPHVLVALRACQAQYEAMVEGRLSSDDRKTSDLAQLRGKLQRALSRYCSAVLTLLDESQPDTLPRVLTALRPLEVHRAQLATAKPTRPSGPEAGGEAAEQAATGEAEDEAVA